MAEGNNAYGTDICIGCGSEYECNSNRQQYCSVECREKANGVKPRPPHGTCKHCGTAIPSTGKRGPLPSTCGSCKREQHRERSRTHHRDTYQPKGRRGRKRKYQPGPVEGTELTLLHYEENRPGYGVYECSCGNQKSIRMTYVHVGYPGDQKGDRTVTCGDGGKHRDKRVTGTPAIGTVHHRIVKTRGSASQHPCVVCGEVTTGNQWAYRHSSVDPATQEDGKDKGQVYSASRDDYWVLCKPHHVQWDSEVQKGSLSLPHVALGMAVDLYGDRENQEVA